MQSSAAGKAKPVAPNTACGWLAGKWLWWRGPVDLIGRKMKWTSVVAWQQRMLTESWAVLTGIVIIPLYYALFSLQFLDLQCWKLHSCASSGDGHQDAQDWITCPVGSGLRELVQPGGGSLLKWGEGTSSSPWCVEGCYKKDGATDFRVIYETHQTWVETRVWGWT